MDIEPAEIVRVLESDFRDTQKEEKPMSQDDLLFLDKISEGIHQQEDGHYSMPLPFKSRPNLPNNRHTAVKRFEHLSRRFRSDPKYYRDYKNFMTEIIKRGDAENIPPMGFTTQRNQIKSGSYLIAAQGTRERHSMTTFFKAQT